MDDVQATTKNQNIFFALPPAVKSFVVYLFMTISPNDMYNENLRFGFYSGGVSSTLVCVECTRVAEWRTAQREVRSNHT